MEHNALLDEIIKSDPTIRFVGMYDCNFDKITDGYQPGIIPHLSRDEMQNSVRYDIRRWETYKMFRSQLGDTQFAMVKYDKAILLTFSLADGEFLRVSINSDADYKTLIENITSLIKKHQHS